MFTQSLFLTKLVLLFVCYYFLLMIHKAARRNFLPWVGGGTFVDTLTCKKQMLIKLQYLL